MVQAVWRYYGFAVRLKKDPNARQYTDVALTPVVDDDFDSFEMFKLSESAKSEVSRVRHPVDARAANSSGVFKLVP